MLLSFLVLFSSSIQCKACTCLGTLPSWLLLSMDGSLREEIWWLLQFVTVAEGSGKEGVWI